MLIWGGLADWLKLYEYIVTIVWLSTVMNKMLTYIHLVLTDDGKHLFKLLITSHKILEKQIVKYE